MKPTYIYIGIGVVVLIYLMKRTTNPLYGPNGQLLAYNGQLLPTNTTASVVSSISSVAQAWLQGTAGVQAQQGNPMAVTAGDPNPIDYA